MEITLRTACPNLAGGVDVRSHAEGGQAMTHHTPKLTDQDVLAHARSHLRDHLPLHAEGSVCTTDDLLNVLLGVAVTQGTIEAVCADLFAPPTPKPSAAISTPNCVLPTCSACKRRSMLPSPMTSPCGS
jgi:hypothetical protein